MLGILLTAKGESSGNVPVGIRNLFTGGVGAGARFGMGIVSSNLGSSWDANSNTILRSVLDNELTLGSPLSSTSLTLGPSINNVAPMLSSSGTYGFILVDPKEALSFICGGIIGGGSVRFCSKDPDSCAAQSHRVKVWSRRSGMEKGFYILDRKKNQAYVEPCLSFADYQCCNETLTGVLEENFTLESCVTMMKALEDNGKSRGVCVCVLTRLPGGKGRLSLASHKYADTYPPP